MIQRDPNPLPILFKSPGDFPRGLGPFIKEVGRGKRLAKDLTREEAREAMRLAIAREATDAQIGALFQSYRIKSETPDELAGMIEAAREFCQVLPGRAHPRRVELGLPYDGRLRAFHVAPFAALIAARAGVQVFFHGAAGVGPKFGINVVEILYAMGFKPAASALDAEQKLARDGIGFMLQADYSPALASLRPLRNEVVLRGPLASVEKMLNLSGASAVIAGATHTPYLPIMGGGLERLMGEWGLKKAWVIQGSEGHVDIDPRRRISIARAEDAGDGKRVGVGVGEGEGKIDGDVIEMDPAWWSGMEKDTWMPPAPPEIEDPLHETQRAKWIEANVAWGQRVLEGKEERGLAAALATAGMLIMAADFAPDLGQGIERAKSLLSN